MSHEYQEPQRREDDAGMPVMCDFPSRCFSVIGFYHQFSLKQNRLTRFIFKWPRDDGSYVSRPLAPSSFLSVVHHRTCKTVLLCSVTYELELRVSECCFDV